MSKNVLQITYFYYYLNVKDQFKKKLLILTKKRLKNPKTGTRKRNHLFFFTVTEEFY